MNDNDNFKKHIKIGNYTKNAVKNFEKNIVSKNNYLEKIKIYFDKE